MLGISVSIFVSCAAVAAGYRDENKEPGAGKVAPAEQLAKGNNWECCCTATGAGSCKRNQLYVDVAGEMQCCGWQPIGTCSKGIWYVHLLAKTGFIDSFVTTKNKKCTPGSHFVDEKAVHVNPFVVETPFTTGWKWLDLKTYHRVKAVKVSTSTYHVEEGESLKISLQAWRFGKTVYEAAAEAATDEDLHAQVLEIHFTDEDLHKEFYVVLNITRTTNDMDKQQEPIVIERKVYVGGTQECGVGFFGRATRNCTKGFPEKKDLLTHDVPNYGLGVEYELAAADAGTPVGGVALETGSCATAEAEADVKQHSARALGEVVPPQHSLHGDGDFTALLERESVETNATQHVSAWPCSLLPSCAKLKPCLWQKAEGIVERWRIEVDDSVGSLTASQTADTQQHTGVPFEIVSPPVVGMAGVKNALDLLQAISDMGAQAPLSAGLHVHVNMRSQKVGANITCSMKEVFAVWLNWIIYQNVIDEMQTPSRVGNDFARSLDITGDTLDLPRKNALWDIFQRGHTFIMKMSETEDAAMTQEQACVAMIGEKTYPFCTSNFRLPHDHWLRANPEKFFQLNLTPLGRFGTFEFRSGTATLDPRRVARWIQFLVAFVDTFKDPETIAKYTDEFYTDDWEQLKEAQKGATPAKLQALLKGQVEDDFFEYFSSDRPFEKDEEAAPQKIGCVNLALK